MAPEPKPVPHRDVPDRRGGRGARRGEAASTPGAGSGGRARRVGRGYAAQGSPRKPPPDPVLVSAEARAAAGGLAELGGGRRDQADRDGARARRPQGERGVPRRARGQGSSRAASRRSRPSSRSPRSWHRRSAAPGRAGHRDPRRGRRRDQLRSWAPPGGQPRGRISSNSPVGAALMGRRVGDEVAIVTPGGQISYKILAID
jgi:hypothetical protein